MYSSCVLGLLVATRISLDTKCAFLRKHPTMHRLLGELFTNSNACKSPYAGHDTRKLTVCMHNCAGYTTTILVREFESRRGEILDLFAKIQKKDQLTAESA